MSLRSRAGLRWPHCVDRVKTPNKKIVAFFEFRCLSSEPQAYSSGYDEAGLGLSGCLKRAAARWQIPSKQGHPYIVPSRVSR